VWNCEDITRVCSVSIHALQEMENLKRKKRHRGREQPRKIDLYRTSFISCIWFCVNFVRTLDVAALGFF